MQDKRILIIEDNLLNRKLVRQLLIIGKAQTLEAETAEKGIQLAREHLPDLILMDIQLPGMNGFDATRMIKSDPKLSQIPVVALTSFAMQGDDNRAFEAGCDGYITKPVNTRTFLESVGEYLK
jgi:CheY-like chemotaxis protein